MCVLVATHHNWFHLIHFVTNRCDSLHLIDDGSPYRHIKYTNRHSLKRKSEYDNQFPITHLIGSDDTQVYQT